MTSAIGTDRMYSVSIFVSFLAFFSIFLSCTPESDWKPQGYALLYGISRYQPSLMEGDGYNLTWSDEDAREMEYLLRDQNYNTRSAIDAAATKERLIADLAEIGPLMTEDDSFILYFSGHGGTIPELAAAHPDEASGDDAGDEWIFFYGSLPLDYGIEERSLLAVSDDELEELLDAYIPGARRIVIIDACNSGGFAEGLDGAASGDYGEAFNTWWRIADDDGKRRPPPYWLCSSTETGKSAEYGGNYRHSVFTFYLLRSRYYGDLDGDGYITLSELRRYATGRIAADWNTVVAAGFRFSPGPAAYRADPVLLRRENLPANP